MDISFWIILWVIFLIAQNVLDKKKKKNSPPKDSSNSPDFEIPTLANDPNFPGEENKILVQDSTQSAEVRKINLSDFYKQKKISTQNFSAQETKFEEIEQKKLPLGLNPESAMNVIIMSEILSKPKALRKK